MFTLNSRILIFTVILTALMTPVIFGQQNNGPTEEKASVSKEASNEAKTETEDENKVASGREKTSTPPSFVLPRDKSSTTSSSSSGTAKAPQTQDEAAALAKKLSNPVASLVSVPFQSNFDFGMGPDGHGFRQTLNIQPVIPITLNKDWNLISRTIIPIMGQHNVVASSSTEVGLGDVTEALFFSPNKTEPFIWAVGPQVMIPTATNKYLGSRKLSMGPTFLILKQTGPWSVGALTGHFWSVAGSSSRPSVSLTNFQPFVSYSTKSAWTYTFNAESTYDWNGKQWNVPLHIVVAKLVRFGKQPVSVGGSLRCWVTSGPTGPEGCGFRLIVTPLFPRKG